MSACRSLAPAVAFSLALLIFATGFLSSKHQLNMHSPQISTENALLFEQRYKKVIFLLIDALRYDFLSINHTFVQSGGLMTVVEEMEAREPGNSLLCKFMADAPTITSQRIYAMTTGTIPPYISIKDNFNSPEVTEDSFIYQLYRHGKKISFVGDDDWLSMYPAFNYSLPFQSFNIRDLDTVDRGCTEALPSLIEGGDYDLLISHFLGVDHTGHRFCCDHPEMVRKLKEMNEMVKLVISKMDNDTLLLLFGDHGMTDEGNHSGDSKEEVEAALWIYSKKGLFSEDRDRSQDDFPRVFTQLDLTATMSSVFGLPFPLSNIGKVFIPLINYGTFALNASEHIRSELYRNLAQVLGYMKLMHHPEIHSLLSRHNLSESDFSQVFQGASKISPFSVPLNSLPSDASVSVSQLHAALSEVYQIYKSSSSYNLTLMNHGLTLLVLILGFILFVEFSLSVSVGVSSILAAFLFLYSWNQADLMIVVYLLALVFLFFKMTPDRVLFPSTIAALFMAFRSVSSFSNSFMIAENRIIYTVLQVLLIHLTVASYYFLPQFKECLPFLIALFCNRLSLVFRVNSIESSTYRFSPCIILLFPFLEKACQVMFYHTRSLRKTQFDRVCRMIHVAQGVLIFIYWTSGLSTPLVHLWIPRLVYLITLAALVVLWWCPHCFTSAPIMRTFFIAYFVCLIQGPDSPPLTYLFLISVHSALLGFRGSIDLIDPWLMHLLWYLYGYFYFYTAGNGPRFNLVHYNAAFIGFNEFNLLLSGLLVVMNTFSGWILLCALHPLLETESKLLSFRRSLLLHCTTATLSVFMVFLERQNMFLFNIFVPKVFSDICTFIFNSVFLVLLR